MKKVGKRLFEKHHAKINSVQVAFRYLRQTFLTKFGVQLGTTNESKLVENDHGKVAPSFPSGG